MNSKVRPTLYKIIIDLHLTYFNNKLIIKIMQENYSRQSQLKREQKQILQQKPSYEDNYNQNVIQSKIQEVRKRSRDNPEKSKSRAKFSCNPSHLRHLKHLLDGIICTNQGDTQQIKKDLQHIKRVQMGVIDDLQENNHNYSLSKRQKSINKHTNSDKLLQIKRFIEMIINNSQKQHFFRYSGLNSLNQTQAKMINELKAMSSKNITSEKNELRNLSLNSAHPSQDNSFIEHRENKSKSKITDCNKKSLDARNRSNLAQIQILRQENVRLQAWLNQEINKNILLQKQIVILKKRGEDETETIINKLDKRDQKTLQHQNNILKSKIKNLEIQLLTIEQISKGNTTSNNQINLHQLSSELAQKNSKIKQLENQIKSLLKRPMKQINSNFSTSTVDNLRKQVRYLQDRLRLTKNDPVVQTMKREIHRLKIENQRLRKPEHGQSYNKMRALLQQNDYLRVRNKTRQQPNNKYRNMNQDNSCSHAVFHNPSTENLFSVGRSFRAQNGHNRKQSDNFSIDYSRPRVQIDLRKS